MENHPALIARKALQFRETKGGQSLERRGKTRRTLRSRVGSNLIEERIGGGAVKRGDSGLCEGLGR